MCKFKRIGEFFLSKRLLIVYEYLNNKDNKGNVALIV